MYALYTAALALGLILAAPYLLLRYSRHRHTLLDRLTLRQQPSFDRSIWLHAVSVGEVRASSALVSLLRRDFPDLPVVMSTTTPAGQSLAAGLRQVTHSFFFPLDLPFAMRRTLDRLRPEFVVVAETEVWPTMLRMCRERRIPVFLVNARLSDRSFPRYMRIRNWARTLLGDYALIAAQSETDRQRFLALGAPAERTVTTANLKFDVTPPGAPLHEAVQAALAGQPLWIAASTMPGEDEIILDVFARLRGEFPDLKLLLAPRHPTRFDAVAETIRSRGLQMVRRSALNGSVPHFDTLLLDSVGELAAVYAFAAAVFVGGSLVETGGHNIIEPAYWKKPIAFGPHAFNFRDIVKEFLDAGGAVQVQDAVELESRMREFLRDPETARRYGERAGEVVGRNQGATEQVAALIREAVRQR